MSEQEQQVPEGVDTTSLGIPVAQPATEAEQDAILRELEPPVPEDAEGSWVPLEEAEEPAEPRAEKAEPEGAKEPKEADPAFERAVAALRRDGFTGEEIHALPKKSVIALGNKAEKRQTDVQAKLTDRSKDIQRLKELEKTLEELRSAEPAGQPSEDTLSAELAEFNEIYGDEFGSKLAKVLGSRETKLRTEIATLKEEREQFKSDLVEIKLNLARARLGERFPALRDGGVWDEKILPKVIQLWPGGEYPSFDEAILDAAKILDLDDATQSKETTRKQRGQPTGNGRKGRPTSAMSPEEQEYAMMLEIEREQNFLG